MTMTLILGVPDPEMALIERIGFEAEARIFYAAATDGQRVSPSAAYAAEAVVDARDGEVVPLTALTAPIAVVECRVRGLDAVIIDHHGDHPAAAMPPERAVAASSVGQVLVLLTDLACGAKHDLTYGYHPWYPDRYVVSHRGRCCAWLSDETILTAAADHCLSAAYRGEVPGVDPDALARFRAESRAAFQGRAVAEVLRDVEAARLLLVGGRPRLSLGGVEVADCRPPLAPCGEHRGLLAGCSGYTDRCWGDIPELPEAAAREGVPFIAIPRPGRDGRKLVIQAAPPAAVEAFLRGDGPAAALARRYGAAARGFAGGYFECARPAAVRP